MNRNPAFAFDACWQMLYYFTIDINFTAKGKYFCATISDLVNGPTATPGNSGFIDIFVSTTNIYQIVYYAGIEMWTRKSDNSGAVWSSWTRP